jgi:putative ABC transport system permease protein
MPVAKPTAIVTPSFFQMAAGRMLLGRGLGIADDPTPSAVISARLWRRAFGGDPAILRREIVLDRQPYIVVGVADGTFQLPSASTDLWRPVGFSRTQNPSIGAPRGGGFQVLARLRPDVSIVQAQADANAISRTIDPMLRAAAIPLRDWFLTAAVRPTLHVLWAAVGLVLLVACANVTNLFLARDVTRTREQAIRLALGASHRRLMLESIAHSSLIALGGAVVGTLLASIIVEGLIAAKTAGIPRLDAVRSTTLSSRSRWFSQQ